MTYDKLEMTFEGLGEHNFNRRAIDLVFKALPDTVIRANDLLGQDAPFDILWKKYKLCIRAARESTTSRYPRWFYMVQPLEKTKIDFYVLFAIRNEAIYKLFVLPPAIVPQSTISISEHGDFLRYKMFETNLKGLADKIDQVNNDLPKLEKLYKDSQK